MSTEDNTDLPSSPMEADEQSSDGARKRLRSADRVDGALATNKRLDRLKKPTLETVANQLTVMTTAMAKQNKLLGGLPIIRTAVGTVDAKVEALGAELVALKATTGQLMSSTTALHDKTDGLAQENAELKRSHAALEARVSQLILAGNANALNAHRSSSSQRNEITIGGLTLGTISEAELLQLSQAILETIKILINPNELLGARLLRTAAASDTAASNQPHDNQPKPTKTTYAVTCKDHPTAARILAAKRAFGPLKLSQVITNPVALPAQSGDPTINFNELLPTNILKLLSASKVELKNAGFKYVWVRNLTVYAKFREGSPVQTINSTADLPTIIQLYTNTPPTRAQ